MILDGDRDRIGPYIRELADLMGLTDWTFGLSPDQPGNENHGAEINVVYGRKFAEIAFRHDWCHGRPKDFRSLCVHELLHCHVNHVRWPLNNVAEIVGTAVYAPLYNGVTDAIEYAVDGIAMAWAETLPLPGKHKKRRRS